MRATCKHDADHPPRTGRLGDALGAIGGAGNRDDRPDYSRRLGGIAKERGDQKAKVQREGEADRVGPVIQEHERADLDQEDARRKPRLPRGRRYHRGQRPPKL